MKHASRMGLWLVMLTGMVLIAGGCMKQRGVVELEPAPRDGEVETTTPGTIDILAGRVVIRETQVNPGTVPHWVYHCSGSSGSHIVVEVSEDGVLQVPSSFSLASSGSLELRSGGQVTCAGGSGQLTNFGLINHEVGSASTLSGQISSLLTNNAAGTIHIKSGELLLSGGCSNWGAIKIDGGATLSVKQSFLNSGTGRIEGSGTLNVNGVSNPVLGSIASGITVVSY